MDPAIVIVGFLVGAAPVAMLGRSFLEDHDRRKVVPVTVAGALVCGVVVAWSLNEFVHFAQMTGQ